MSRRQKVVVVAVFAALALLYAAAAGTAGRSGGGDATARPGGVVGWLDDLVGPPPDVPRGQLHAPCLAGAVLTVKGTCVVTVARAGGTRRVRLHADAALAVTSRPPRRQQPATTQVKAGADITVVVDGDGGDITIACPDSGATCAARLPQEPR